ncbi:MAG TPA: HAMP domain-containing sensor histidine kinase [Actinomycetota bacterium]
MSRRRHLGLRWRIMIAFLGGALAVSALVAGTTYYLAARYLWDQRVDDSTQQSISNVRFAVRYLSQPAEEASLAELVDLLESRGTFEVIALKGEQWFASSGSMSPDLIPAHLADQVDDGRVAYVLVSDSRRIIFGSPIPGGDLVAYFFYSVADVDEALGLLWKVLLLVGAGAVILAAVVGIRVSRRVVHPVRRASEAARQVAEGLLETRLPVASRDEIGTLADSFNQMAAALETRIRNERRFVGDVSHELRTPLTTLRASTDYLLERADELPVSLRRATELLGADLDYLQRLVDDLLDISRVEAGRVEMSLEPINLADLTREVIARHARAGGDVRLVLEAAPPNLTTVADKQRLERVVGNLVDNAIVHGAGADVTVRLGLDNGGFLLSVEDRGPGIPPHARPRIFERFYKGDPARRRGDGRGSGLGLAIARENAHLHGGEILVESRPGSGSRFTFKLPRREPEP